jgi:hypothetical protein
MVAGTGLTVVTTVSLFVSKLGWRVYWGGLNERVYIRSGDASLRRDTGYRQTSDPRFPGATLLGLLGSRGGWYALLDNLEGDPVPDLHDGMHVVLSNVRAKLVTPYAVRSRDAKALLPFSVIEVVAGPGLPVEAIRLELFDFSAHLLRTEGVTIHHGALKAGS